MFIEGLPVDDYVAMLRLEMRMVMAEHPEEKIETVYVGGGTHNTLTPTQLAVLCTGIRDILLFELGEFTFEAHPHDLLTTEQLQVLHDFGVNRLSIGVTSFNDDVLKRIGRILRDKDVYTAIGHE